MNTITRAFTFLIIDHKGVHLSYHHKPQTIKATVRRIGTKVCYTFDDEKFFICDADEAQEDLNQTPDENGQINVNPIYYILAR